MAELTAEQFDMLYLRRSQQDLNLVIEMLLNEGSISVPADAPAVVRAKEDQDAEREADKERGGEGKTAYEYRAEQAKAEAKQQEAAAKEAAKAEKEPVRAS
jgi:hypothetical protein